ncbi:APC family permease [Salarchaeum sp. JOR-1]|uniref:APC family permease n=1 Tax=Salarchaeum sp. JOR-1 TaxID=2599399 RepID=UPI001198B3D8|nr:APC family permease [Salarchaeum sp. JOR-1]QDX41166.1 APC family permease [Salarchaeum sp. JOR-1]
MVEKLGLKEVVAMGVGGMVSGGIFAALGVAMQQAGNAVPISYILAGGITLLTAYSYIELTLYFEENGGAFSFVEHVVDNPHIAGFFGWVLIAGYIGTMAMYAFAFGAYSVGLLEDVLGVGMPWFARPAISVGVVVSLIGVNLVGVRESGFLQDVLVYIKAAFLLGIAVLGVLAFEGDFPDFARFFNEGLISPITGFAIIFVSYEGFQLLTYDYNDIENARKNLRRGMYISIITAIVIYVSVSFMATLHLTPTIVQKYGEYALAKAVVPFLGSIGFVAVVVTAIQSTASGINATLFGSSRLAHRIATENELPRLFSFRNKKDIPTYALLVTGGLTAVLTAVGSLKQIVEFGSIAFLIADSAANYTALRLAKETGIRRSIPLIGLLGTVVALPLVLFHLYITEFHILVSIVGLFTALLLLEFLYIEREQVEWAAKSVEEDLHLEK